MRTSRRKTSAPTGPSSQPRQPTLRGVSIPSSGSFITTAFLLGGLFFLTLAVYLATLAPTVTWLNGGADGAELATAAYVWGVAHPPGYPLYLTLVRAFQLLPFGDLAHRAALFSACAAALTVPITCLTCQRLLATGGEARPDVAGWHLAAGAFAGLGLAFGPLLWSQAVVAEVYTFGALLFSVFLLNFANFLEQPAAPRGAAAGTALALLISHQPTFAVAVVPLGWIMWRLRLNRRIIAAFLWPLMLVPLLFATLWLRASVHPAMNWGQVDSWQNWVDHVTARIYRIYFLQQSPHDTLLRVPYAAALLVRQGGWCAVAAAGLGLVWLWATHRRFAFLSVSLAVFFVLFAVLYAAKDGEVYLLPAVQVAALSAGVGAAWLLHEVAGRWRLLVILTLVVSIAWQLTSAWPAVDASSDTEARDWGVRALAQAPPGSIIHSTTDEHTFVLWYLQHAERRRPDVAIVEDRLLEFPWYRSELLRLYPSLAGQHVVD